MSPTVSIIIPVYNRFDLIGDTLDSISKQTFVHWECLIVDDGSTDATAEVVTTFVETDARFQYHKRPRDTPKGANACRNYGLELAQGDYIVFFDSDDLMTPKHLKVKVQAMLDNDIDFAVAQTRYFNHDGLNKTLEEQYEYTTSDISAYNYITHKINWLTYDVIIKSTLAKTLRFNENLQSGQEYNFFSKLTLQTQCSVFLKDVITKRRYHEASIRGNLRGDKQSIYLSYFRTYWFTFLDTRAVTSGAMKRFLLYRCYRQALKLSKERLSLDRAFGKALMQTFGLKGLFYVLQLTLKRRTL